MSYRKTVKLIDIANAMFSGGTPSRKKAEFWEDGEIPWLKTNQVGSYKVYDTDEHITNDGLKGSSAKLVKKNSLVIAMYGDGVTRGKVSIVGKELTTNQACCNIEVDERKAYYKFIYYLLKGEYEKFRFLSNGGAQQNLSVGLLKEYEINIPELDKQKKIASILSSLDDKIELNNEMNKTLEEMAQALFKRWFVDFEFPDEEGKPYKSSGGEMIESELGIIPKGWNLNEIGQICDIQNGFAFKATDYVENGIKVLRTLNIDEAGYFQNDKLVFLPKKYNDSKFDKYRLKIFDVALVMVGAGIGKIGIVLENTKDALQNQNMWRFRSVRNNISQIYLKYLVKEAQNISQNWATGSAREFYRKDSFSKIKVVIGDELTLERFNKIVGPIFNEISQLNTQNDKLIELRDYLLPKLMSGEIRVDDIEVNL